MFAVAVIEGEGMCAGLRSNANMLVTYACDGLDLLLKPVYPSIAYVLWADNSCNACITDHSLTNRTRSTFGHFNEAFTLLILFPRKIQRCAEHPVS